MIGRADNRLKRFALGIQSMEYIFEEIKECEMKIISNITDINYLIDLVNSLFLEKNVKFYGYISSPDIYFKNASLHIFPSFTESFGLVLSETKIYGIPNILVGINYISIAKGGTFIIYDETPESIGKESIKILLNIKYRYKMGKEARTNLKIFNNKLLLKKWIKIILSIYFNNSYYYEQLKKLDNKITEKDALNILKNQIKYINKKRYLNNTNVYKILNFSFI
jgi:glycosyltransferase involved in cell wall biosynthesis